MSSISQLNFLQALGWALLNSLWQMALLWVAYNFILSFLKMSAGKKTSLATFMVTAGFAWFVFTFFNSIAKNEVTDFYNKWSGFINESAWTVFVNNVLAGGSIIYFTILIIPVWKFIRNYQYVQNIRNNGLSKIKAEWRIFVKRKADYMGIARKVEIWISEIVNTPVTVGWLKPIILIPVAAINHLSTQQVEAIILHELSHIRRFDYIFNLVINFIKTILYFNPFVKLFVKTIERERENSCDELVLQYQYQAAEYASALLLLEKNNQKQMMMAAAGKEHDLLHRIESILGVSNKSNTSWRQVVVSFFTLLGIAAMNILFTVNTNKEISGLITLRGDISPYYFYNKPAGNSISNSFKNLTAANKPKANKVISENLSPDDKSNLAAKNDLADYQYINYTTPVLPELTTEDEVQLKETIGATKKILEVKEWNELEKSYAEVFNSLEKAKLKNAFQQEVNNIDWKKLENKLRLSYENIDWTNVHAKVNSSLAQITLDSLQTEVNIAMNKLTSLETWMNKNNVIAIPDSDISLDKIKVNQDKAKVQLDKIRIAKTKKIVRL